MTYLAWVILAVLAATAEAADPPAGTIKVASGAAFVERQGTAQPAQVSAKVFRGDALRTGADGSLGVLFRDDTSLSLGPNTELVVDEFLFAPAQSRLGFVARLLRGTAVYLSGIIAKLAPDAVRIETPVATVGIRGTKILLKIGDDRP
jgi:hypothetical protein